MKYLNRILKVEWSAAYILKLHFRDGFIGELNFAPITEHPRGPMEEPLRDVEFFKQAKSDGYTVTWPNQYDLCPDVLRFWCERGHIVGKEETDAAFLADLEQRKQSEPAALRETHE